MSTVPENSVCSNHVKTKKTLRMFLKRFTCPFRHSDIVPRFAKLVSQICMATNNIINHIYTNFGHLLKDFEHPWLASQPWLATQQLSIYAFIIHAKGAPLQNS